MASYPNQVATFSTHVNVTEIIDAGHPNAIQNEVIAIESTIGTTPSFATIGTASGWANTATDYGTLSARLANIEKGVVADTHTQYIKNSVVTTAGDIIVGSGSATVTRLGLGANNTVLVSNGTSPSWVPTSSLPGIQGVQGNQGVQGIQGTTGAGTQGVQGVSGIATFSINAQVGTSYTPVSADVNSLITLNNASAISVTVPTNASVPYAIGTQLNFVWITGAGQPTITAVSPGTTTILSTGSTSTSPKLRVANSVATAIKLDTDKWLITGDIV
jgi:hypothetical protein